MGSNHRLSRACMTQNSTNANTCINNVHPEQFPVPQIRFPSSTRNHAVLNEDILGPTSYPLWSISQFISDLCEFKLDPSYYMFLSNHNLFLVWRQTISGPSGLVFRFDGNSVLVRHLACSNSAGPIPLVHRGIM